MIRLGIISNHLSNSIEVCIVAIGRSPIAKYLKEYQGMSDSELAGQTLQKTLEKYKIATNHIEEFYIGKVFTQNLGQAFSKQVLTRAQLTDHIPCMSVNKLCSSGMKALTLASLSIRSGNATCVLAGGVECMSNAPYLLPLRQGIPRKLKDSMNWDGFPDAVTQEFPVQIAEAFSHSQNHSKPSLDAYASLSCQRAKSAASNSKFSEIVSITNPKTGILITKDSIKPEKEVKNSQSILKNGVNTSGNSCGINDGASFILLCSREKAIKEGWKVLGSVIGFGDAEQHASLFPSTPRFAAEKALAMAGVGWDDVDFVEINEPFACVVLDNMKHLKLPIERVNVYGGVISLGHPVGSTGCRIVTTLMSILEQEGGKIGLATICNAGGGGTAIVVKKEPN